MTLHQTIMRGCWALGVLSILAGLGIKLFRLEVKLTVASHTAFLVAAVFFLCVLATRAIQRN